MSYLSYLSQGGAAHERRKDDYYSHHRGSSIIWPKDFDATVLTVGTLSVNCKMLTQSGTVDFTFEKLTIKVPYHEFVWEAAPGQCFVGAAPVSGTTSILGDRFFALGLCGL